MTGSPAYSPEEWPIAAAMNQFSSVDAHGTSTQDQTAEQWASTLTEVRDAGYSHFDPMDPWLRLADLSPDRVDEFCAVAADLGLAMPALSTSRRSPIDPDFGDSNMEYLHRAIDTGARIGASIVSVGFMRALTPKQQEALWFWTAQGPVDSDDADIYRLAVERVRELVRHAQEVGVAISLEMYEDTLLGTADGAVKFVEDVDLAGVGLNPDLGNLVRLHRPIEAWEVMVEKTVPLANYWHIKNYVRTEDADSGWVVTSPSSLETGVINYRWAVRLAVRRGYGGAFCTEHYGGDAIGIAVQNREYLRRILPR